MIKQRLLKLLLIVFFPIGIYVWWANRDLKQKLADSEAENEASFKRETVKDQLIQERKQEVESLQKEADVRANLSSRPKVMEQMRKFKHRSKHFGKNRG